MKAFYLSAFVFSIFFAVVLAAVAPAMTPAEKFERDKKILQDCKISTKATDEDIKIIFEHGVPTTHTGKCLVACTQEKVGIIANGKLSFDNMKALVAAELQGDAKAIATIHEMIKECEHITDPDVCEVSGKMMDCMNKAAIKRGFDPKTGQMTPKRK